MGVNTILMKHITINSDRSVTVPVELRKIGVQYDHNVNTIEFVGPRYSGNVDLSTMTIYINYILSDKTPGKYKAENVIIDDQDDSLIRFNWTITRNVTKVSGILSCLVCAKKTDEEGNEINHWNTDIFRLLSVSEGMENDLVIQEQYPDVITSLIQNVEEHDAKLLEFSGLNIRVNDLENNIDELKDDIDDYKENTKITFNKQYADKSSIQRGKYYWVNRVHDVIVAEIGDNNDYSVVDKINLKKGKYYIKNVSQGLSFIIYNDKNIAGVEYYRLTTDDEKNGYVDLAADGSIYITTIGTNIPMISDGIIPSDYIYGAYNVKYNNVDIKYLYNKVEEMPKIFRCGSKREFTRLKDAIEEAIKHKGSYVYVDAETFDLVEEYGQDYLDSYDGAEFGIHLANDVHVIFDSGAKVIFDYEGTNTKVHQYFSPFNARFNGGGFELINAWVESKNCRYSVHDEHASDFIPYRQIYRHCTFIHDSSGCSWGPHQAIGGGLGQHGDIVVEDCYGKAAGTSQVFSWHQGATEKYECKSNIVVKGCYLEGTVEFGILGHHTNVTNLYVHGNSFTSEPTTTLNSGATENMKLMKWNNEIRN